MYVKIQQPKSKIKVSFNVNTSGVDMNRAEVSFKENVKPMVVMYNKAFASFDNPTRTDVSFPVPAEISNMMRFQTLLPNLNELIDTRSRKQALIMS